MSDAPHLPDVKGVTCEYCGWLVPKACGLREAARCHRRWAPLGREGVKHDEGKDPWHLMPWDALRCIVKVLAFGARKYEPRNWEKGMDWDRCYRAAIEHLVSWYTTKKPDEETGFSHLWHAGCCILFLIAYELRGLGKDTRP